MHVAPPAHEIEHEPVQRTVHVEPAPHDTLPLAPIVTSQSDSPLQLMLHDAPHVPVHVFPIVHASVQLSPLQPESPMSHDELAGHVHDVPLHSGGGVSPPHANRVNAQASRKYLITAHATRETVSCLRTLLAHAGCALERGWCRRFDRNGAGPNQRERKSRGHPNFHRASFPAGSANVRRCHAILARGWFETCVPAQP